MGAEGGLAVVPILGLNNDRPNEDTILTIFFSSEHVMSATNG